MISPRSFARCREEGLDWRVTMRRSGPVRSREVGAEGRGRRRRNRRNPEYRIQNPEDGAEGWRGRGNAPPLPVGRNASYHEKESFGDADSKMSNSVNRRLRVPSIVARDDGGATRLPRKILLLRRGRSGRHGAASMRVIESGFRCFLMARYLLCGDRRDFDGIFVNEAGP